MNQKVLAAIILTATATAFLLGKVPGSVVEQYHTAKEVCEGSLPRNQECVMYFKPE